MIEILTTHAVAKCRNCGGEISLYKGDLSRDKYWSHTPIQTGGEYQPGSLACPGSPVAEPLDGTVVERKFREAGQGGWDHREAP